MRIIIYNFNGKSKILSELFKNKGFEISLIENTAAGLIREIKWGKPFAVIVPPEIQDANAVSFIERAKNELSGFEPLFFVYEATNDLKLCNILRKAGFANVFYTSWEAESILDSVVSYSKLVADSEPENLALKLSKNDCKMLIRSILRKMHFDPGTEGFRYTCDTIYLIVTTSEVIPVLKNLYGVVAVNYGVTAHLVAEDIRNAVVGAWKTATRCTKRTMLSDFTEQPRPKEVLLGISNFVLREIVKIEKNIFETEINKD